jgi:beta-glucuronidase
VFVDNVNIGEHRAGGYQPFWLTAPASGESSREILVVVNNKFNGTTAPTATGGDFYFYGGITRNVIVHEQPAPTYILRVETFTTDYKNGVIDVRVVFGGSTVSSASLSLSWDGGAQTKPNTVSVKNGVAVLEKLNVPNASPWSLEKPNLHQLRVNLHDSTGNVLDAVLVRFGIRIVSTVPTSGGLPRVAINDQIVKLHGINRHTMWPDTGSALTLEQIQTDVSLLRSLGANYVRGAHYPQDQRFLDLCDEYGIAIWEETLGPGVQTKKSHRSLFHEVSNYSS